MRIHYRTFHALFYKLLSCLLLAFGMLMWVLMLHYQQKTYHHLPPTSVEKDQSFADFLAEIACFVENYVSRLSAISTLTGTCNTHWDVQSDNSVKRFADLLESVNIIQYVQVPTHTTYKSVQLVIKRGSCSV